MVKRIVAAVLLAMLQTLVFANGAKESRSLSDHNASVKTSEDREDRFLIQGRVVDENGQPVLGATVAAYPDSLSGKLPMSMSDSQGRFTIRVYKTGRWRIKAHKPQHGYPLMSTFYYPSEELFPQVILNEIDPPPFVTVMISRAGKLSGRIVDEATGQSIQNAHIGLCRVEAPRFCHRQKVVMRNGQYEVLMPSAPTLVQISADGYEDWYINDKVSDPPKAIRVSSNTTFQLDAFLKKAGNSAKSLEAPQLVSPVDGTEFFHYPRLTRLEWLAVPAAVSYTVEVEYCSGEKPALKTCEDPHPFLGLDTPPTFAIRGTSYEFSFLGGQPGRWRVWAIDAEGRPGAKSAWSMFFYRL